MRESVAIADACFDRLLEIARHRASPSARSGRRCTSAATRSAARTRCSSACTPSPPATAGSEGRFGPPVDRVLERGEQLVFSFELVGRMGYWMEFARMVVFGEPDELQRAHERRGRPRGSRRAPRRCGRAGGPDEVQRGDHATPSPRTAPTAATGRATGSART